MKRIICILLAALFILPSAAFAEETEIPLKLSSEWITLDDEAVLKIDAEVSVGREFSGEMLLFKIIRPDVNEGNEALSSKEKYARVTQHYLDNEGKVSFSFNFKASQGVYTVTAQAQSMDVPVESEIVVPAMEKISELLSGLSEGTYTGESLAAYINENKAALGMTEMTFNSLKTSALPGICGYVVSKLTDFTVVGFMDMLNEATAVKGITKEEEASAIAKIFEMSVIKNLISADERYENFKELSSAGAEMLYEGIKAYSFEGLEDVKVGFMTELSVAKIRCISSYSEISGIFESFSEELGAEAYAKYSALNGTQRSKVNMRITERLSEIETAEDFSSVCKSEINKVLSAGSGSGGSSGGGSSGGGGGLSKVNTGLADVSTKAPEIPVPVVKKEAKDVFSDVPEGFWGYEAIDSLYQKGIIKGKTETEFFPEAEITRAEFLKLVTEGFGIKGEGELSFNDVTPDKWYYPYVSAAFSNKLVNGVSETLFGADNNITRQDAAVIIYRVLSGKEPDGELNGEEFTDKDKISGYAVEAINYLSAKKLLSGFNGEIKPLDTLTRAEGAQMLFNILK